MAKSFNNDAVQTTDKPYALYSFITVCSLLLAGMIIIFSLGV